jgi:hypothetical protein
VRLETRRVCGASGDRDCAVVAVGPNPCLVHQVPDGIVGVGPVVPPRPIPADLSLRQPVQSIIRERAPLCISPFKVVVKVNPVPVRLVMEPPMLSLSLKIFSPFYRTVPSISPVSGSRGVQSGKRWL